MFDLRFTIYSFWFSKKFNGVIFKNCSYIGFPQIDAD